MNITDIKNLEPIPRDVSPREYFRGCDSNGREFVLMRYPEISLEHNNELLNFIKIGNWLSKQGVKTPQLYDLDKEHCIAKFEDLGRVSFGAYLRENPDKKFRLYTLATKVLKVLARSKALDNLPLYNDSAIHKNRRQIVDYYMPYISKKKFSNSTVDEYLSVWNKIEQSVEPCSQGFIHGDYHLENLIYMEREKGINQCALIDYQDALYGYLPYDLVNLLEDARVDIEPELRQAMIDLYCEDMGVSEKNNFLKWYRILGTQFHCRVIGLFIKLAAEQERDEYLVHINRLQNYILKAINDPLLSPLKDWFEKERLDFEPVKHFNGGDIRAFFNK